MARLQILELPDGPDDTRPPFALVVDECEPERVILGMDHTAVYSDRWTMLGAQIGARGVVVTPETVAIPANELLLPEAIEMRADGDGETEWQVRQAEGKLKEFAAAQRERDLHLMDQMTEALGLDRLRDWDEIVRAARTVRGAADEGGHRFGGPGANDPVVCSVCRLDKTAWLNGDVRTCETVRIDTAAGHRFNRTGLGGQLRCYLCGADRIAWAASRDAQPCEAVRSQKGEG
ncbi:hypothetical protein [Streptomyces sp. NPDC096324]|uniref:hypothetical protein n=1 Tax=Streptomyces sp. NPDC096324 TaxID=3366085 RepID=UPI00381E23F8